MRDFFFFFCSRSITTGEEPLLRCYLNRHISQVYPISLTFHTCFDASAAILKQTCTVECVVIESRMFTVDRFTCLEPKALIIDPATREPADFGKKSEFRRTTTVTRDFQCVITFVNVKKYCICIILWVSISRVQNSCILRNILPKCWPTSLGGKIISSIIERNMSTSLIPFNQSRGYTNIKK